MWTITTCLAVWWHCMLESSVEVFLFAPISVVYLKEML